MLLPTLRRNAADVRHDKSDTGLTVDHLTVAYAPGQEILHGISLRARPGEILAILGKSGIGKTTLLNALSGLKELSSGSVKIKGSLAYVMQKDLLLPWRTVLRNILLPTEITGGDEASAEQEARELLGQESLADISDEYPQQLSGGMRQKVSFIRMQVADPDIVLLDEPFSALDYVSRLRHGKRLRDWAISHRKVVIYVTHDIEEAIGLGDRLLVLGGSPSHVLLETQIRLDEQQRDPAALRETQAFRDNFSLIWQTLKA